MTILIDNTKLESNNYSIQYIRSQLVNEVMIAKMSDVSDIHRIIGDIIGYSRYFLWVNRIQQPLKYWRTVLGTLFLQ